MKTAANELRIGSCVWLSFIDGSLRKQVQLNINQLISVLNGDMIAEPVEITEEWLFKLGFDLVYDSDFTKRYDFVKDERFDYMQNKGNERLSGIRFKGNTFYDEIKAVHQFQNFYFAITGLELSKRVGKELVVGEAAGKMDDAVTGTGKTGYELSDDYSFGFPGHPLISITKQGYKEKYEKCIAVIKKFDAGIIGMYDL